MMPLFRGPSRVTTATRSFPHGGPALTRIETSADNRISANHGHSESEVRLIRELSVVLARRPVRRLRSHPLLSYADIEPPEPPLRVLPPASHGDRHEGSERLGIDDQIVSYDRARLQSYDTTWLATTRRLRRNRKLHLVTSWSITILVGSFIVSVAAVILFGPPGGKFAFRKQLEVAAGQEVQMKTTQAAPAGVRWQLD